VFRRVATPITSFAVSVSWAYIVMWHDIIWPNDVIDDFEYVSTTTEPL
jgi:hypothetical protein